MKWEEEEGLKKKWRHRKRRGRRDVVYECKIKKTKRPEKSVTLLFVNY